MPRNHPIPRAFIASRKRLLREKGIVVSPATLPPWEPKVGGKQPAKKAKARISGPGIVVTPSPDEVLKADFESAMYPTTMGPDEIIDRLGYGEIVSEYRRDPDGISIERRIRRMRSGSVLEG